MFATALALAGVRSAFDAYGEPIVSIGRAIVREGCGFGQPQVAPPDAGSGTGAGNSLRALLLAAITGSAGILTVGAALRGRRFNLVRR